MPSITWPEITFGPINLWNCPRQMNDYVIDEKRRAAANRRADALRLNPRQKPNCRSTIVFAPKSDDNEALRHERMKRFLDYRAGVRR